MTQLSEDEEVRKPATVPVVLVLAVLITGSGCSAGGKSSSSGPVAVGAGLYIPGGPAPDATTSKPPPAATPPVVPGPSARGASPESVAAGSPTATAGRSICLGPDRPSNNNVETRTDASGWKLTLTVGPKLCFATTDDINLEIDIANSSSQTLQFDSNQVHFFSIVPAGGTPGPGWQDTDCSLRGQNGVVGGPLNLPPGTSQQLDQSTYPSDPHAPPTATSCRHLKGVYDVYGIVRWCPPGSTPKGYCDTTRTKDILSAAIRIRIS